MKRTGSRYQSLLTVIKWLVFVLSVSVVVYKFSSARAKLQPEELLPLITGTHPAWYLFVLLCTCCNWLLESFKWKCAMRHIEPVSAGKSLKAVLAGLTLSSFVPYRVGEYVGRVMYLEPDNRLKGSLATVMASLSQLCATCLFGLLGLVLTGEDSLFRAGLSGLCFLVFLCLYFNPKWLYRLLTRIPFLKPYTAKLQVLNDYKTSELVGIGVYSLMRYLSFALPYIVLLRIFGIPLDIKLAAAAVFVIFMVQTLLPTFLFSDLLVRGSVPLGVIGSLTGESDMLYMLPGYVLYVFNILLPVLVGGVIILISKYKTA